MKQNLNIRDDVNKKCQLQNVLKFAVWEKCLLLCNYSLRSGSKYSLLVLNIMRNTKTILLYGDQKLRVPIVLMKSIKVFIIIIILYVIQTILCNLTLLFEQCIDKMMSGTKFTTLSYWNMKFLHFSDIEEGF